MTTVVEELPKFESETCELEDAVADEDDEDVTVVVPVPLEEDDETMV